MAKSYTNSEEEDFVTQNCKIKNKSASITTNNGKNKK